MKINNEKLGKKLRVKGFQITLVHIKRFENNRENLHNPLELAQR